MQLFDLIINNINFKVKRKIRRVEEKLKEGSEEKKRFRYRARRVEEKLKEGSEEKKRFRYRAQQTVSMRDLENKTC